MISLASYSRFRLSLLSFEVRSCLWGVRPHRHDRSRCNFSLIEFLAVVVIMVLVACVMLASSLLLQQYYSFVRLSIHMPHSSAVVVLTRVYVASPRHTLLSAACGSFDYRRLPPPGVAPCILLLLRAVSGGPGLLLPPDRSKIKAQERYLPTYLYCDTPCSSFVGHPRARK